METAKQLEMYKVSPFAVLDMNPEDIEKLRKGIALLQEVAQASQPPDERAQAIAQLREKIQEITQSEEFKNQPREKQQQILAQLKGQFEKLSEAQPAQGAKPAEKK
jgi:predicted RNA-binding Zn ribbon-like protein